MIKQGKYYSPHQMSPIYHYPKPHIFPEWQMFYPSHTVCQQPEMNNLENRYLEFSEGQVKQDFEANFSYQEEIIEQECNRPTEENIKKTKNQRDRLT